jgi:hypothetical protein
VRALSFSLSLTYLVRVCWDVQGWGVSVCFFLTCATPHWYRGGVSRPGQQQQQQGWRTDRAAWQNMNRHHW